MKLKLPDRITDPVADDRGVSPVVGVALLIAITVILSAVIGFVVLDTSANSTSAKNARLDFDTGTSTTEITHEGGDTFEASNLVVKTNGTEASPTNLGSTWNTGETIEVSSSSGTHIVVVWEDPESDREIQLGEATVE